MRIPATLCLSAALILCCAVLTAHADVPQLMNYQGILLDTGGNPITTTVTVRFSIHNDVLGGTLLWAESQSITPDALGRFNVLLGEGTSLPPNNPLDDAVFVEVNAYLEIQVESDPPMAPRTKIVSDGFAFRVSTVDGATGGTISTKLTVGVTNTNTGTWGYVYGRDNDANGEYTVITGGHDNTADLRYSVIGGGQYNYTSDEYCTIAGGEYDTATGRASTISGGSHNAARGDGSIVAGGFYNQANDDRATVSGGVLNIAGLQGSTVAGGYSNAAGGDHSTVSGGEFNTAAALHGTVGGGDHNTAGGQKAFVGGGANNNAWGHYSVIAGGGSAYDYDSNSTQGSYSGILGGRANIAGADYSSIGGGRKNTITSSGEWGTISGGYENELNGQLSTIGGGFQNVTTGGSATVAGGSDNVANSSAAIGGGGQNTASGIYTMIPGGYYNTAEGQYSFAAGRQAMAIDQGTFVWADDVPYDFSSTATREFSARATGGVRFVTAVDGSGNPTAGVQVAAGGGSWSSISDRNLKENFSPVDAEDILARLAALPISTWNYKAQDESIRHIGPMAQDLYAAFGVGESNRHITTIDADGIALAAIQGLTAQNQKQKEKIEILEDKLARLEAVIQQLLEEQQ